jgi:hypothetical protein
VAVNVTLPLPFFFAFLVGLATITPGAFWASFALLGFAAPPVVTVQSASQVALSANLPFALNGALAAWTFGLAWLIESVQPFQLPRVGYTPTSTTVTVQVPPLVAPLKVDRGCVGLPFAVVGAAVSAVQNAGESTERTAESVIVNAEVFG